MGWGCLSVRRPLPSFSGQVFRGELINQLRKIFRVHPALLPQPLYAAPNSSPGNNLRIIEQDA